MANGYWGDLTPDTHAIVAANLTAAAATMYAAGISDEDAKLRVARTYLELREGLARAAKQKVSPPEISGGRQAYAGDSDDAQAALSVS